MDSSLVSPFTVSLLVLLSQSSVVANLASFNGTLADQDALLSFKLFITSDPFNALSSWNQNSYLCNWTGVSCDKKQGRVTALDLQNLRLTGTITPHIGNLSFLRFLHLQNNQFAGTLPDQIGNLLHLEILDSSWNRLQGTIPHNITRCLNLTILSLAGNRFSGEIPTDLDRLSKVRILKLGKNQLTGILPPSLANLSSLTTLGLATNVLQGPIPYELGRLWNLQHLRLSINNLSGTVPLSLYNISSLQTFTLASNKLWGRIPADIGFKLPNLLFFNFCINNFTGIFPASLYNATKIQLIRLSHNLIEGTIPEEGLGRLRDLRMYDVGFNRIVTKSREGMSFLNSFINNTRLEFLSVQGNFLEGSIPESIGNLSTQLTKLYMGGNRIFGSLPATIGRLTNLALLNLSYNSITGNIPPEIGQVRQLQVLDLAGNKLSGVIPASLGNLDKLIDLELFGNDLEGTIPSSLGNFQRLLSLDLSNNKLNGSIPKEIFGLSGLGPLLNLSRNSLSGSLPSDIWGLVTLVAMDVSENRLSGTIPESIGNCKSLQGLFMAKNSFSGTIPRGLGGLKGLQILDLSSNQLSGYIPSDLTELKILQYLNLSFNALQGKVPKGGVFMNLSATDLSGNAKLRGWEKNQERGGCHSFRRKKTNHLVLITVSAACFILLCITILGFFWVHACRRRKSGKISPIESFGRNHRMVSYQELAFATGNFSANNLIGAGSFGSVYRGILRDGTQVAVKVLDLQQQGACKSFHAECEALRNVRHRNLVKLITTCSSTDLKNVEFRALVFEYMGNGSLDEWVHSRRNREDGPRLKLTERLDISIDIASALDYLHHDCEAPVVHCDLKPSNVLLDKDMTTKVGDFGLSRIIADGSSDQLSRTLGLKGSIGYIAPEYGMGAKPSTKGDVYSYGIMLLELFTGKTPTDELFTGDLSIQKWVGASFPSNIMDVVDPDLQLMVDLSFYGRSISWIQQQSCLISVMGIGLSCVEESPEARTSMRNVLKKLQSIRDTLSAQFHM